MGSNLQIRPVRKEENFEKERKRVSLGLHVIGMSKIDERILIYVHQGSDRSWSASS